MAGAAHSNVPDLARFRGAARWASHRLRVNRALSALSLSAPAPLLLAIAWRLAVHFQAPAPLDQWLLWSTLLASVGALVWTAIAALRHLPPEAGALALDAYHESADRIAAALSFATLAPRTPFMDAAIQDAVEAVPQPVPGRAVPLKAPLGLLGSVALAMLLVASGWLPEPKAALPSSPPGSPPAEAALSSDDTQLVREQLEAWRERDLASEEVRAALGQMRQLVEQLEEGQVDRAQALRKLAELRSGLEEQAKEEQEELARALQSMARELARSDKTKALGAALSQQSWSKAQRALQRLAEQVQSESLSEGAKRKLQKALQAAAEQAEGRKQRLQEQRQGLHQQRRRLLKKKKEGQPLSPAEAKELERNQRRLERLNRQLRGAQSAAQELSKLDRELAEAARKLQKAMGDSAQHLQQGAQDMQRIARRALSDKEKRELKKQMEEMAELLRRSGSRTKDEKQRLEEFLRRARGQQQGGQGQGQQGKGPLRLSAGGQPVPIPGMGTRAGSSPGQGARGKSGSGAGQGEGPDLSGKATRPTPAAKDVSAVAADTGQGEVSSEVLASAAQEGFAAPRYKNVYTQYNTVAEEVLEKESIPAGYEFYVRRYFQLIRPRSETAKDSSEK